MQLPLPVIVYRYDASPFSAKIDNVLTLKGIPHYKVNVPPTLPRPEITDALGISYRRIPILAIGNDVYCDTSLIATVLERRFNTSAGYGTIFPPRKQGGSLDTSIVKAFAKYYADATLFSLAPSLLPWEKFPSSFVEDRSQFIGASGPEVHNFVKSRGRSLASLSSHLSLLEEQLSDGREWLFDTELPGLADISVHFVLNWIKGFQAAQPLFQTNQYSFTFSWLSRLSTFINTKRNFQDKPQELRSHEAAAIILSSSSEPYSLDRFDTVNAERLGLKYGDIVQIAPDDTGKTHPTSGKLVCFGSEEVALEVKAPKGILCCHFPRLGYTIKVIERIKL